MKMFKWILISSALIFTPSFALAAGDDSPQPTTTTSGSRSGTLIQTDVFPDDSGGSAKISVLRADLPTYKKAQRSLSGAIRDFRALSRSLKGKVSPKQQAQLNASLKSFNRAVRTLGKTAQKSLVKGNPGNKLSGVAAVLVRFDGVDDDGRVIAEIRRAAKVLGEFESKLGRYKLNIVK